MRPPLAAPDLAAQPLKDHPVMKQQCHAVAPLTTSIKPRTSAEVPNTPVYTVSWDTNNAANDAARAAAAAAHDFAVGALKVKGAHVDQVHQPRERVFEADGNLNGRAVVLELLTDLGEHAPGVGARAVTLVDERESRNGVAPHLAVHCDRLRLHAACAPVIL